MSTEQIADAINNLDIQEDKSADKRMIVDALGHLADAVQMLAYCTLATKCLPSAKVTPEAAAKVVGELEHKLEPVRKWYGFGAA